MTSRTKHLRYNVFNNHTIVHLQFIKHNLPIQLFRYNVVFIKSMTDKQPRVGHVTFHGRSLFVQVQSNTRFCSIIACIDNHSIVQPEESRFIIP